MAYRMKRWRHKSSPDAMPIYTCARPGRRLGPKASVPDCEVNRWLSELPKHRPLTIISLLGHKPDGMDEHAFYTFKDASGFRTWIAKESNETIKVFSHPTTDFNSVGTRTISAIKTDLDHALSLGHGVVIVDSGGVQRTGQICQHLSLVEDSRTLPQEP